MNAASLVPEIVVSNVEASLEFYVSALGFEVMSRRDTPALVRLNFEGSELMIEELQPDSWVLGELTHPFGRGVNFQIRCADVEALRARLEAAQISVYRDLENAWYEAGECLVCQRQFLVADPDGYLLRFCQTLA